jgi:hypothetical protein
MVTQVIELVKQAADAYVVDRVGYEVRCRKALECRFLQLWAPESGLTLRLGVHYR